MGIRDDVEKCCICGEPVRSRYYRDSWGNISHMSHNGQTPSFCFTCGRIVSSAGRSLGKEDKQCGMCTSAAVTSDAAVELCRKKVLSVFRSLGITGVPEDIPVMLVPLDDLEGAVGRIHYYGVRGTLRMGFHIRIAYGLQELYFRGILAHEMLHSWLALYGRKVTDDEREGFCNLGEAFVYTREDTALAHYLLKQMYKNSDAVYGAGYRLQKERYEKLGWEGLLKSLRHI